jgi:hypothetical protein
MWQFSSKLKRFPAETTRSRGKAATEIVPGNGLDYSAPKLRLLQNVEIAVGAVYDRAHLVDLGKRAVIDRAYRCFFVSFATPPF